MTRMTRRIVFVLCIFSVATTSCMPMVGIGGVGLQPLFPGTPGFDLLSGEVRYDASPVFPMPVYVVPAPYFASPPVYGYPRVYAPPVVVPRWRYGGGGYYHGGGHDGGHGGHHR